VQTLRGATPADARVVITTAPGEEAQVDYGEGPIVRYAKTGKYRRTRLFVMTLGYSRKSVRLLVWQSSAQTWAELHERAFRRLGGTVRVIVLDNLKEGVLTPDIYEPALNPLYRDVLTHYGVVALPCRVGDPDRKGKVESGVGHAQKTPLQGLRFETLDEAQAYLGVSRSLGDALGGHAHSWHDETAGDRDVLPRSSPRSGRCRSSPFGITASACARCISTAAWKSTRPTTARRPAGLGVASTCSGMIGMSGCSIPRRASCSASISVRRAGGIASRTPTDRRARRRRRSRS
jgi:hypothetical protein